MTKENTSTTTNASATRYVTYLLGSLSSHQKVDPESARRAVEAVDAIYDEDFIFPSASADADGNVTLHWVADEKSIHLYFGQGESYSLSDSLSGEGTLRIEGIGFLPIETIRREVESFSEFVRGKNSTAL